MVMLLFRIPTENLEQREMTTKDSKNKDGH